MSWSFDNTKPIYLQIMEKSNWFPTGTGTQPTAPTVENWRVNLYHSALSDLEREGFVYSRWRFCHRDLDLS